MQKKKEALYTALPRLPEQLPVHCHSVFFQFLGRLSAYRLWHLDLYGHILVAFTEGFCMEGTPFPLS